jgi:hypothetical protein
MTRRVPARVIFESGSSTMESGASSPATMSSALRDAPSVLLGRGV